MACRLKPAIWAAPSSHRKSWALRLKMCNTHTSRSGFHEGSRRSFFLVVSSTDITPENTHIWVLYIYIYVYIYILYIYIYICVFMDKKGIMGTFHRFTHCCLLQGYGHQNQRAEFEWLFSASRFESSRMDPTRSFESAAH